MGEGLLRRIKLTDQIAKLCKEAGCDEQTSKLHRDQFIKKRWHPHPRKSFVQWWEPWGFDKTTGASIGGHEEAYRRWARPEPDGSYAHGWYGITTVNAWNAKEYFEQYKEWLNLGAPNRAKDFISLSATTEGQLEFLRGLKGTIDKIGKQSIWIRRPVVVWDDDPIPTTPQFQAHIKWLEAHGVNPPIIRKRLSK
jgi:hypothetical protein